MALYSSFVEADGTAVDYQGIEKSPQFADFEKATKMLHFVDLEKMDEVARKVFFINLYNTAIIHGRVRHKEPNNMLTRLKFFSEVGYKIGGFWFSLNDMEHGILRSNGVNPATGSLQWSSSDPRLSFAVPLDPRIHFALVCGAKSCPPIRIYTEVNYESALQLASLNFIQNSVQVEDKKVTLSMIMKWYAPDFGGDSKRVLEFVVPFLENERAEKVKQLIQDGTFKITYAPYDWASNSL
uniref:DUF547 domain-containing protein n=1 Tax=Arcella intermedia TaxID=1963864 RepID=A0A6B2LF51_9EUKA